MYLDNIVSFLKERRDTVINGGINCIPLPFLRFRDQFPGIEAGKYYIVTGATKASKTQLATYLFIINTVLYVYEHPGIIFPKIFYFPLEETKQAVSLRFAAFLLNHLYQRKYHISPTDLKSTDDRKPCPEDAIKVMEESEEYRAIFKVFEDIVIFEEDRNPTGIWKTLKSYAEENGTSYYVDREYDEKDELGNYRHVKDKKFDHYEPNNPKEIVIIMVDHVGCLKTEQNLPTLKQTIEKLSEYLIILRNHYNYSAAVIQQQNMETTNLEAFKANKIRPTKDGLKDSKKTGEDCNVLIGVTNPHSFELSTYMGYDIKIMQDSIRFMEIVLNRDGRANGICPLYFDGAVNSYRELPPPTQTEDLQKWYTFIKGTTTKVFLTVSKTKKNRWFKKLYLFWHKITNK